MARLGKILLFVHTGLSLCLCAWALALWYNRVDWTTTKATPDKPAGQLAERMAEYERSATASLRPADQRYRHNRAELARQEGWRPYEQNWYAQELTFLRTGDVAKGDRQKKKIREAVRGPAGTPNAGLPVAVENASPGADLVEMRWPLTYRPRKKPDNPKSPIDEEAQPKPRLDRAGKELELQTFDYYRREIDNVLKDRDKAAQRVLKAAGEEQKWTNELKGVPPDSKGLHALLRDEYAKQGLIGAEYGELRPQWLNAKIELQNLEELRERLERRKAELEGKEPAGGRPAGD